MSENLAQKNGNRSITVTHLLYSCHLGSWPYFLSPDFYMIRHVANTQSIRKPRFPHHSFVLTSSIGTPETNLIKLYSRTGEATAAYASQAGNKGPATAGAARAVVEPRN